MKLLSLFSGIGAFEKALDRCNINYELVNYCEIDKYASKAYSIIHNVDESKNLKDSLQFFINNSLEQEAKGNGFRFEPHVKENADLAKTITTRAGGRMDDNFILDNLQTNESKFTFNTDNMAKIIQVCNLVTMKGDYKGLWSNPERGRVYSPSGLSPTLTSTSADEKIITNFRIRKLTPKECWRLMGFDDEDIDKCIAVGISNSQLYKQAGNSIVVNCIEEIYKRLFKG